MMIISTLFRDPVEQSKTVQDTPTPTATEEGASKEAPTSGTRTVWGEIQSAKQRSLEVFQTLLPEALNQK